MTRAELHPEAGAPLRAPGPFYSAAGAWVIAMLVLGTALPRTYRQLLQEDHFIEWWTVGLFAAAGVQLARRAWPGRRYFDLLVALFCLFVAGEEFSWGQRLLGFTPPRAFLEHNTQQELTIHNFADAFGRPKSVLILALLGYGVVLPAARRSRPALRLIEAVRATPPPDQLVPAFAAAVVFLLWYPVDFTGEWVEALAGASFLMAAVAGGRAFWKAGAAAAVGAAVLTLVSARGWTARPADLACATREVQALLTDVASGGASRERLHSSGSLHKRVRTAVAEDYLDGERLRRFTAVSCPGETAEASARRRGVGVDPWGMAYWIRAERRAAGTRRLVVYSMGPNRRRDGVPGTGVGDDVAASAEVDADR